VIPQLRPAEVKAARAAAADSPEIVLLDVRELPELALSSLPEVVHIPMGDIPRRLDELDPDSAIVVMCHHGVRSMRVALFLKQQGFSDVSNLRGGIDAWSLELDPAVPRY